MEVHIDKSHSDILECGICEHTADDLENLETYLFTCELFRCNMKEHINAEHGGFYRG